MADAGTGDSVAGSLPPESVLNHTDATGEAISQSSRKPRLLSCQSLEVTWAFFASSEEFIGVCAK